MIRFLDFETHVNAAYEGGANKAYEDAECIDT